MRRWRAARKWLIVLIMGGLSVGTFGAGVEAASITYSLNNVVTGNLPAGAPPWATAKFEDAGDNKVTLTLTGTNLIGGEFISEWDFNFDPALDLKNLTAKVTSCVTCSNPNIDIGPQDGENAGAGNKFDIGLKFETSNKDPNARFSLGDVAVITFTYTGVAGTLDVNDFNFLSASGPGFHTEAHVQAIPTSDCSGWISDTVTGSPGIGSGPCGGTTTVPEPSTLLLVGSGVLGLSMAARRFFRR